jgi:hypothetical protein
MSGTVSTSKKPSECQACPQRDRDGHQPGRIRHWPPLAAPRLAEPLPVSRSYDCHTLTDLMAIVPLHVPPVVLL